MFGKTPDQKYQHYLEWFAKEVSDPANWDQMRKDRDCANYQTTDRDGNPIDPGKPVPFPRGEALVRMADPRKLAKAVNFANARHAAMRQEESKYVSEGGKKVLANPEYEKNWHALKKTQEEIKRSYSVYTQLTDKQMNDIKEKHREALEPQVDWKPMTWWQALLHWLAGNEVQQVAQNDSISWRDQYGSKRK